MSKLPVFRIAIPVVLLSLLSFAILHWLGMPAGSFVDWLLAIAAFVWLTALVIVPWNIMFEALEVINAAKDSEQREIRFDRSKLPFVERLYKVSLIAAIALHLLSAAVLYWLAAAGISVVGYYAAAAALFLTLLRPALRAYEHFSRQLSAIRHEILYPRDDVATLMGRVDQLGRRVESLAATLDQGNQESWLCQVEQRLGVLNQQAEQAVERIRQLDIDNQKEHQQMASETRHAVAQLSEDGKFIDNLVEIVRFFKRA